MLVRAGLPSRWSCPDALGLDRSYVRRILVLATLAPDLAEAIAEGKEPTGPSPERLSHSLDLEWEDHWVILYLYAAASNPETADKG